MLTSLLFFLAGLFQNGRNLPNREETAATLVLGTTQTVRDSRVRILALCGKETEDVLVIQCVVNCACVCVSVIVSSDTICFSIEGILEYVTHYKTIGTVTVLLMLQN